MKIVLFFFLSTLIITNCSKSFEFKLKEELSLTKDAQIDSSLLMNHLKFLSSDELKGRNVASEGNQQARTYLVNELISYGLKVDSSEFKVRKSEKRGVNVWTEINGYSTPNEVIVISAHYDHVGVKKDSTATSETDLIYNGADDNASGTSALLEIAKYFSKNRPEHSIVFFFADAEENGIQGSAHFVVNYFRIKHVILNLNMDMISRSDSSILNIAGLNNVKSLVPIFNVREQSSTLKLTYGHDGYDSLQDWTYSSDHGPFYKAGIPFLYFGVEDHPDYHKVSDEFKKVNYSFYLQASNFILNTAISLDKNIQ